MFEGRSSRGFSLSFSKHTLEPSLSASSAGAAQNYDRYKNLFITPVWGDEFVREFLEISLPSQLSAGNLGTLHPDDSVYCIVTSERDKQHIDTSEIVKSLRERVSVQLIVYDDIAADRGQKTYDLMHEMYNQVLGRVRADINCFFLSADIFCSDGLFTRAIAAIDAGKKVVFVPTMRVVRESFVRSVRQTGEYSLSASETVALLMKYEQIITRAGVVNDVSGAVFSLPSHTVYRMDNGYVGRWNVMHPLVVRLRPNPPMIEATVDWNYGVLDVTSRDEIHVFWDSDDGVALTTAPEAYTQGGRVSYIGTDKMRINNLIRWLGYGWALNIHVLQMDGIVCLHSGPIDRDQYNKGIIAVDRIWKPFRDVIARLQTSRSSNCNRFLNNRAISIANSRWILLKLNPIGAAKGALRKLWRKLT
jgi:hypothetical protein